MNSSRRILTVTHYFAAHGGGVEVIAHQLIQHLAAQHPDWRFDWCASAENASDDLPPNAPNISHHAMANWNGTERKMGVPYPIWSPRAIGQLWRLVGACDAAHLHDFAYMGNALAALFCRLRGKPYVVTQHIGWVPYQSPILRGILNLAIKTLGRRVLAGAARVVFYSDVVTRFFARRMKLRAQKINNGVDSEMFAPVDDVARARARRENELDENARVVLFVGRFVEKKGVPLVMKLAAQMPDAQFVLVGGGPLDPEKTAREIPANVRVWRGRRGVEVAQAMQLADVLVLPSRGEGFPLVIQESLACGTPVLVESSLSIALPDVADKINTRSLDAPDVAARWGAALRDILDAPATQAQRQTRADWARQTWSWETSARRYGALLEAIICEARA